MANRPEHQRSFESNHSSHRGVMRQIRANKRNEAELRNEESAPDKRRSYWRALGFDRQSHCARTIKETVADVNTQAKDNKQRSQDWPLVTADLRTGLSSYADPTSKAASGWDLGSEPR